MPFDLPQALIQATVQLEQPAGEGKRIVGTGFLISAPTPDGRPRTVLVTATHVFEMMPGADAKIGYRVANADGSWDYAPEPLKIRDADGKPLWTGHPARDVAAMAVKAPDMFVKAAIPRRWLAQDDTFAQQQVTTGDEMMALGFPRGLSANTAGFAILRAGRVASFPVGPAKIYPTFLLDFAVFPGNSGGPVFVSTPVRRHAERPDSPATQFIAGILSKQVELNNEHLGIGVVTHAAFIGETIALLDAPEMPAPTEVVAAKAGKAVAAGETSKSD